MPSYTPPLRDMQFVMHELLHVVDDLKAMPAHADMDADTMNAVLEEGGKFASDILFPLNISGDAAGEGHLGGDGGLAVGREVQGCRR